MAKKKKRGRRGAMLAERRRQRERERVQAELEAREAREEHERRYRGPMTWEAGASPDIPLALVLRAALRHLPALVEGSPWLPIPQNSCSFSFGPDEHPLPIGAAERLWSPEVVQGVCGHCHGRLVIYGGGGLFTLGGLSAVCISCGRRCRWRFGGFGAVHRFMRAALADTQFEITGGVFGGCVKGSRWPLWRALWDLGARPLPPFAWAYGRDPTAFSMIFGGR